MVWQPWKLCMTSGVGGGRGRWSGSHGSSVWRVVWVVVMEGDLAEVLVVEVGMAAIEGSRGLSMKTPIFTCNRNGSWFRGSSTSRRRRRREEIELGIRGPSCLLRTKREKRKFWDFFFALWKCKLHTYIASIEGTRTPQPKRKRYTKSENILTANISVFLSIF